MRGCVTPVVSGLSRTREAARRRTRERRTPNPEPETNGEPSTLNLSTVPNQFTHLRELADPAADASADATGHEEKVERTDFVNQLTGGGALAGDDVRVIVGWNQRQAAFGGEPPADGLAILVVAIVEDHLAAVAFGCDAFHRRRVRRH